MTPSRIVAAARAVAEKFQNFVPERHPPEQIRDPARVPSHVRWMVEEIAVFVARGRILKATRWLGFVQGVVWTVGLASVQDLMESNRPAAGDGDSLWEAWEDFLQGQWVSDMPQVEGIYAVCPRDAADTPDRLDPQGIFPDYTLPVFLSPTLGRFETSKKFAGWWWNRPLPLLPVPPSFTEWGRPRST